MYYSARINQSYATSLTTVMKLHSTAEI